MSFNEKVHQLRRNLKITQRSLAKQTSMTQASISRIESGKVNNLRPSTLIKLASALNVTIDYLIGKADKMTTNEMILADPNAKELFTCFEKLPMIEQKEIVKYAKYLDSLYQTATL
ncbi:MAG: hypothetical protein A2509_12245 [Candidatus Edwardsbacteria bacterium RIFOXYD12_FULL_50_11]|uniref:HTH cro/C1-type domain-containing protein n=1 Tax=Candidatus Edwardsbacteria bacterium GWF2_54_11 TaxID=1817851 RepID=A0A1F5R345_9BACT|nr:MAG: hypothetical protein A2502_02530 [Candidatus Edwardsbacteria bacterium RifOxyC12_full_54_24]OGF08453.1 MAG: hypothetical protein A2024_07040 [Candidatus Edwardsbacteria bacterium GWF2_54_11]OGF09129.1 MAG: hypothetical protein A2273_10985 [Candidatus Edwardsbacteria bacterium RifOxyA12_full_54_48]OGF12347.1 MAG: hypothetical protein A3K15_00610 [Candidatus Edwardsbacteria bacterium GWE2_54_12]OGF15698.1 MAG: hypothetical protein A2509_12245 [Candidatus Edwardsbacteria bacterium RIFOXYD1